MDWCLLEEAFLGEVVNISTSLFIGGVRPRRRVCGVAWAVEVGVGVVVVGEFSCDTHCYVLLSKY